ncbi:zf-HC2 domain-containing protein [Rugosimonospora acidiphila]|uniref:Zf-HC2 domain-containing protein n=1 Tax=Rugosimonospora acidiphila TaxID=556531 RepID=A0ABP9S8F1_9ACTN
MRTPENLPATGNHVDIGGYLAKALDPAQTERVEEHLAACEDCRTEVDSLREWADSLEAVPDSMAEAMLLDGPPEGGDLLLQRTLRQIRTESAGDRNRRRAGLGVAAAAVVAAAISAGVAIGHTGGHQSSPQAEAPAPSATASTAAPGTRFATVADPATGARITVAVAPQTGWVRVTAAVSGIPAGQQCQLFVVKKDGTAVLAGSWVVSAKGAADGTTLDGTALIDPSDVAGVRVSNTDGKQFASANL